MANNIIIDQKLTNAKLRTLLGTRMTLGTATEKDVKKIQANLEEIVVEIVENASFLVPAEIPCEPVKQKDGTLAVPSNTEISFVIFSTGENQKYIPIFSDTEEFNKWDKSEKIHAFTIDFTHMVSLLEQSGGTEGLVLNPYSDNMMMNRNVVLKWREQFQIMKNGSASHAISIDKANEVYNLNPYPFQLMNTLCEAARSNADIKQMWLRGINLNNEDSYLLVVDYAGDRKKNFDALGEAAKKFLGDKPLHIVPFDDGFGGKAVQGANPIYTKD
ncbi:MAG: enhanced serine sensitivity protein SseB C-terminal domain-containing protein [Oscillospiraceae bacterium]